MLGKYGCAALAAALTIGAGTAEAARGEGAATARQAVVRCGGSNFLRLAGSEVQYTSWVFRNFDASNDITIDRMRVFDANGAVHF